MSRLLLTGFGGLVCGAAVWVVCGSIAASVFSKMPGGSREGGGAMAGFFFVGPACGFVGLLVSAWLLWRLLANPERTGIVGMSVAGLLVVLIIGVTIAVQPTIVEPDDFKGQKAELLVEVSFPPADLEALSKRDRIDYELRAGDGTETAPGMLDKVRHEGGRAILPGAFQVRARPRSKILAVMKNDTQVMSYTLTIEGSPDATTEWSEWQELEAGFKARWRLLLQ